MHSELVEFQVILEIGNLIFECCKCLEIDLIIAMQEGMAYDKITGTTKIINGNTLPSLLNIMDC